MADQQEDRIAQALKKALDGDHPAFAELVKEHQGMVFSIAWHFVGNRALAEDLAQEVFLQLYQKLSEIQSPAHLIYWLRRVTAHRCIDQTRRLKPELGLEDAPPQSTMPRLVDPLLHQHLRKGVAALPEKWRAMVILRYQEELDLAEISELLDIPLNTVKSGLQRSLAELRKRLTRKLGGIRYAIF